MSEVVIVCNMGVFTPDQREKHIELARDLFGQVVKVASVQNGFAFDLPNETDLLNRVGGFIANERRCCPFLRFDLEVRGQTQPITLTLSGPEGTQEFLKEEFQEAFE